MKSIKELLYKMADDALIVGHRNSEWTGIGPVMEEDIAFSSMAQDKVGHALALYTILHEQFGEASPDELAFLRNENLFRCCHLVEYPIGEWDFTTTRHFLFDHADALRHELLTTSSFEPLAQLARKIKGELKYHVLHANSWFERLAKGSEESKARMQSSLNEVYPLAQGIFEDGKFEMDLIQKKLFPGEKVLKELWRERILSLTQKSGLHLPEIKDTSVGMGGRNGYHTEFLKPLLEEMGEVLRMDPKADW